MSVDSLISRRRFLLMGGVGSAGLAIAGIHRSPSHDEERRLISAEQLALPWLFEAIHVRILEPGRAIFNIKLPIGEDVVHIEFPRSEDHPQYPDVETLTWPGRTVQDVQGAVREASGRSGGMMDSELFVVSLDGLIPRETTFEQDSPFLTRLLLLERGASQLHSCDKLRWLMRDDGRVFAVRMLA